VGSVDYEFPFSAGEVTRISCGFSMDKKIPIIFSSICVFDEFDYVCSIPRSLPLFVEEELGGVALFLAVPLCPFWIFWI
jgi:hypothetical protein